MGKRDRQFFFPLVERAKRDKLSSSLQSHREDFQVFPRNLFRPFRKTLSERQRVSFEQVNDGE
jgi:hypothetical protein